MVMCPCLEATDDPARPCGRGKYTVHVPTIHPVLPAVSDAVLVSTCTTTTAPFFFFEVSAAAQYKNHENGRLIL